MENKLSLRDLRKRSKVSVVKLSEIVGVSTGTWYRWEGEKFSDPGIECGVKIAQALGCTLDEVIGAIDPPIKYPKEVTFQGETYIRCTLIVQEGVYKEIDDWVDFVEFDGAYTNKDITPRRKGKAIEFALQEARECFEFQAFLMLRDGENAA